MGVKVYLLKRLAGPSGNWPEGSTVEVSEAQAKVLVAVGAAELIAGMKPYVVAAPQAIEEPAKSKREMAVEKAVVKREKATEV